jgi:hypothetical protein
MGILGFDDRRFSKASHRLPSKRNAIFIYGFSFWAIGQSRAITTDIASKSEI